MSWKKELKLIDIEPHERLEFTCKTCGLIFFATPPEITEKYPRMKASYIDEVEKAVLCRSRFCKGHVRLVRTYQHMMEGFVGGLA